jgi:hypothetical protein
MTKTKNEGIIVEKTFVSTGILGFLVISKKMFRNYCIILEIIASQPRTLHLGLPKALIT